MNSEVTLGTNWPSGLEQYKIVQLELDNVPYLRFGKDDDMHALILQRFLDGLNVRYDRMEGASGDLIPKREGDRYKVSGMGFAIIYPETKRAIFGGESVDYDIGIDKKHLESLKSREPEWTFDIRVGNEFIRV